MTKRFTNPGRDTQDPRGFTLIELCLVVGLIATLMAIALPHFLPAISYSALEGAALHLGHYGRAAMAQAVLSREQITVRIDLDKQEYKCVRKIEEIVVNNDNKNKSDSGGTLKSLLKVAKGQSGTSNANDDAEAQAEEMQATFDTFARLALQARAKNVEQEGILSDIGPLFEKEFKHDPKAEEKQYEELKSPLLEATLLPESVRLESVHFGGKDYVKGTVKIDISPLGLSEPVQFYIRGETGDYYSILWDAITGEAIVAEGKQSLQ